MCFGKCRGTDGTSPDLAETEALMNIYWANLQKTNGIDTGSARTQEMEDCFPD
jgi:hypothetical protein